MEAAAELQKSLVKEFEERLRDGWKKLKDLERINDGSAKESGAAIKHLKRVASDN